MSERARRIAENEVLFRQVSAQLLALDERLGPARAATQPFLCECGDSGCEERIALSLDEYERVHADRARFAIATGHERADVEAGVERHDGYPPIGNHEGASRARAQDGSAGAS